mgnify:CR=1 FL=1
MAGFHEIIGHEQLIAHLQSAIVMDKVSHAYIINGPKDSGKMMLAQAFAMALQCETSIRNREGATGRPEEKLSPEILAEPCLECHSCKQALGNNQPDIIYLTHEKPNTISVADIREQINHDIEIKPYSSKYKVYIVDEAEKMNQQAQNALLKTIEEPPAYAVILLLTTNADAFFANNPFPVCDAGHQAGERRENPGISDEETSGTGLQSGGMCSLCQRQCGPCGGAGFFRTV